MSGTSIRVATFAVFGALALVNWARLVPSPPVGRLALGLGAACLTAAAAAAIGRAPRGRRTFAVLAGIGGVALAALAAGVSARLLSPAGWDELAAGIGDGLAGIEDTALPYTGEDAWVRLTLILAGPTLLAAAAVVAFWPGGGSRRAVIAGLVALVFVFTVPATLDAPTAELGWGGALFALAVAWLCLPTLARGAAGLALAATLAAAAAAIPIASALDRERPVVEYQGWDVFAGAREVSYQWNHSYGPLSWPQRGTTLLEVRSPRPLYWKASVLDRFDGFTWQRADPTDPLARPEIVARLTASSTAVLAERHPRWVVEASFEVRELLSDLVIGAGAPLAVEGIAATPAAPDGTVRAFEDALTRGVSYSVETYAPRPTVRRLRSAPAHYPATGVGGATLVGVPATVPSARDEAKLGFAPATAIRVPGWGRPRDPGAVRALHNSPYGEVQRLATRLTAGAPSVYDAVRAIERHLADGYDYSHNVPEHTFPLASFVLADRSGYCQQFAGSMALMLRMVGIPSRVVSGFAPGTYDPERELYAVRDTDAHSWVEVYFRGIGWVPFDPTPAAAPAASQTLETGGPLATAAARADRFRGGGLTRSIERRLRGGAVQAKSESSGMPWGWAALGLLTASIAALAGVALRGRRLLASDRGPRLQAGELESALGELGWALEEPVTLLAIERRFGQAGRTAIALYAEELRRHRFAPGSPPAPGAAARRRMRRALVAQGGIRRRLRAWLAVPPGGPRPRVES